MKTSSGKILFTAHEDVAIPFLEMADVPNTDLLHLPLESFINDVPHKESERIKNHFHEFVFIIHANLRNARHFTTWMEEENLLHRIQQKVNITADKPTADFLETKEIPAVMPKPYAQPIDVIEFLLRISQQGRALYPATDKKAEEIPGLLQELEMPVTEFTVCKERTIEENRLHEYRRIVKNSTIKAVLFHNRSSVTRIQTAYPNLDLDKITCISGGPVVTQKLKESGIRVDLEANGSWHSLAHVVSETLP